MIGIYVYLTQGMIQIFTNLMLPAVILPVFTACSADSWSLQDESGTPGHDGVMQVTPPQAKAPTWSFHYAGAHRIKPKNATLSSESFQV